jgi:hypothetical protein
MGENSGNLRTLRNQSGTVGSRTLGSIIASSGGGAGSSRRVYGWYAQKYGTSTGAFKSIFNINRGQFKNRV